MGLVSGKGKKGRGKSADALILSTAVTLALTGQAIPAFADEGDSGSSSSGSSSSSSSGSSTSLITPLFPAESSPTAAPSSSSSSSSSTPSPEAVPTAPKELTPVNPLEGLFQQQPQYPTPGTTQKFPSALSPNMGDDKNVPGRSPGQAGEKYQSSFKDPFAVEPTKNITEVNPLKGLFQQQPQYPSPNKTQMFPEAIPKHLGDDGSQPGRSPGQAATPYQKNFSDPFAPPPHQQEIPDNNNYVKGLFQQQPQYPSPNKTVMFPEAVQQNLGDDASQPGRSPGSAGKPYDPYATPPSATPSTAE
ncbi:MAG: hypothetical protein K2X81_17735, partial [Candidatus Obscuribacterales bacterium]|nr:hypothetical protein [Candidatus Obscuribacterales bacterium]